MTPLQGHIQTFYIPYQGRKLGPYYARCWKENGRQRKQYIKAKDLAAVRRACELYRQAKEKQRETSRTLTAILTNMAFLKRSLRRSEQSLLTEEDRQHLQRIERNGMAAPGRPRVKRSFMVPSQKRGWSLPTYAALKKETKEETWQRWRTEHPQSHPTPWYPARIPTWITEQEAKQAIEEIATAKTCRKW